MTKFRYFVKRLFILFVKLFMTPKGELALPNKPIALNNLRERYSLLYRITTRPVTRKMPATIGQVHHRFLEFAQSQSWDIFVIEGKSWRVWGNQGAVITADNYLLSDVSREFSGRIHSVQHQIKLVEPGYASGRIAVLAASGGLVYYHWMFDILTRIGILKESKVFDTIDKFIINSSDTKYQEETLVRAGVLPAQIIKSNDHWKFHLNVEELIIPSLVSPNDCPSLEACNYLRQLYSKEIQKRYPETNIYIKRKTGRTIINELEVLIFLRPFNFQVLELEDLSVADQAAIFANAKIVIGAHGAGLTNIVFCRPDTIVIDLFSPEWINPCYWIICEHLNLRYGYLIGKKFKQPVKGKAADIFVHIGELNNLFVKMELTGKQSS